MSHLTRSNKGDRWTVRGEGITLAPGDKIELKVGEAWILTEVKYNKWTNEFGCKTPGLYMYENQPARLPRNGT